MNTIELLSPVGDFECLKAAVQSGADCVYFGANLFNARASANNFDDDELKRAIEYAKLRNVKTNLTLNILIKNNEFREGNIEGYKYTDYYGTTDLVAKLINTKHKAVACGNIGYSLSQAVIEKKNYIKVVEVSSFMLENADTFSPNVATILNIEPDHLIRHKTMEEYTNLKLSIFKNLKEKHSDLKMILAPRH